MAPVSMWGMMGTAGALPHTAFAAASIADKGSGASGDGGLGVGVPIGATTICGSARTRTSVCCTAAASSIGRIRQLTVACAVCGSAFSACPACSIVATHVVRRRAL